MDVAAKVLADILAARLDRALALGNETPAAQAEKTGASKQVNRARTAKLFSRWIGPALLLVGSWRSVVMTG